MMNEFPEEFDTVRGLLRYSTTDTGDRYLAFGIEPEDFGRAMAGRVIGMIIPAGVSTQHLDQVLGEILDLGGVRFVVVPPSQ